MIVSLIIIIVVNQFLLIFAAGQYSNLTCGKDNSPIDVVYEGVATIDTYPWLGYLFYLMGKERFTTVVVLVTKQIVLGTATEIDKLPKSDFRTRARVVIGQSCIGPSFRVRDYSYHPDYGTNTYSAIAMVQLDLDGVKVESLRPICPPPTHLFDPNFYAMTLTDDCSKPVVMLYEMKYVDPDKCKIYYRKYGLDINTIWPTHTACAQAKYGGKCVWRGGAVLALYQGNRWHLVGLGVHGPGCEAPARFLDYGMYHQWVRQSVLRIGKPTITRIGDSEVILRRSLSNLQRFGICDPGEMETQMYTEHTSITSEPGFQKIRYNMTIYADIEYSCVVFRASNAGKPNPKPKLRLRRWCSTNENICSDWQYLQIDFYVEITFFGQISYDMTAYGGQIKAIDTHRAMKYLNAKTPPVRIPGLQYIQLMVNKTRESNISNDAGYSHWYHNTSDSELLVATTEL